MDKNILVPRLSGQFVGVPTIRMLFNVQALKRAALLFDTLFVEDPRSLLHALEEELKIENDENVRFIRNEIEWLIDAGILVEFRVNQDSEKYVGWFGPWERAEALRRTQEFLSIEKRDPDIDAPFVVEADTLDFSLTRKMAATSREQGIDAVGVFEEPFFFILPNLKSAQQAEALPREKVGHTSRLVFEALPQPDEKTPWEAILDFRSDDEARSRLLQLRRWIRKTARGDIPANEVGEELEFLLHEYSEAINHHKLKYATGALETFVTTTFEVAENIVKFKWSKTIRLLFSVRHQKIDLLEAEAKAPGREVSYILHTRKTF